MRQLFVSLTVAVTALLICGRCAYADTEQTELIELGRLLFFDAGLSFNRSASCASCHNPATAYSDNRHNDSAAGDSAAAVSTGADGHSLGDRNTPALTYAAMTPDFQILSDGSVRGGFFSDGRAPSLALQSEQPMLDPLEMAMPDRAAIAARLRENPDYIDGFRQRFGADAIADDDALVASARQAIAAFESSEEFFAFDSKYDRFLAGEYQMTRDEAIGRELFFSDLTNCRSCHLANPEEISTREPFTNFEYHNVGTPVNERARAVNGLGAEYVDPGLAGNPQAPATEPGKFRVPSLRNVAVTAPYMHNGVFTRLETAVVFYGRHLASNSAAEINPETGAVWREPEIAGTVDDRFLPQGQPLEQNRVRQLVAFLKTLTDRRYEHLLQ